MPPNYNYDSDFGRDLLRMYEILHGKITLIGPQLSFAGLHMAPYSFYIFAPFLLISNFDHRILFYVNSFFFLLGFLGLYIFFKKKWGKNYAFLSILWFLTTPYVILAARSPGNAFSYLILLISVICVLFYKSRISNKLHFVIGLLEGLIINFHPINILITIPLHIGRIILIKKESLGQKIKGGLLALLGISLTFSPIALFEIKHGFVITKSLLNPLYYLKYFSSGKDSPLTLINSFFNLNTITSSLIPFSMLGLLFINGVLFLKMKRSRKLVLFFTTTFLNVLLLFLLKQGAIHYFLPTLLLLQIFFLILNYELKFRSLTLIILIGINFLFFPVRLYQPTRNLTYLENNFRKIEKTNFLPHENLNVILINETPLSKVGYEYRFLLKKYNYSINDEYSYNKSKYLLVVDEENMSGDLKNEWSWEFEQFGNKKLLRVSKINGTTFFLFKKQ